MTALTITSPNHHPAPGLWRLTALEARKSLDTRAGAALGAVILLLTSAAPVWKLTHLSGAEVSFASFVEASLAGTILLLPVVGILAMTSEWSQRTISTTLLLVPRRGVVVAAKLAGAVLIGLGVAALATVVALASTLGAVVSVDQPVSWSGAGAALAGAAVAAPLYVVLGVAVGALLRTTVAAVVTVYLLPTVWGMVSFALFREQPDWLDINAAVGRLSQWDLSGAVPQTATALAVWIVVPLVIGTVRSLRSDVG